MEILCATDLLPKSEAAVERAGMLADQLAADLTLLHVVTPSESQQALEQTLHTAFARMRSRAQAPLWKGARAPAVGVRAGSPTRIILDTLAQSKPQLLVLGPHRKRPLRDALEGTIAEKALAARSCPVLIVQSEARTSYRRALLALDLSESSASALRAAESLVLTPAMDAWIVHSNQPPSQALLEQAGVGPTSLVHLEQQTAATGILRAIERYEPDLLVVGARGGGRLRRALVGSVANRVLHEIACDALIVPEGSFGVSGNKSASDERHPRARTNLGPAAALYQSNRWGP